MSVMEAIGKGVGLANMMGPQDKFIEKATEQQELAKSDIQDKIEVKDNKISGIQDLQRILVKIKAEANSLLSVNGIDKKTTSLSTQAAPNVGAAEDYLQNVHIDSSKAINGDTKIAVAQVATKAEYIMAFGAAGTGFAKNDAGLDGTISLTVNGVNARATVIAAGDSPAKIVENINQTFKNNDEDFEAFLINGNANTVQIQVRAKNTGLAAGAIVMVYADNPAHPGGALGTDIVQQSSQAGTDAIIHVNGAAPITQASNTFIDPVDGISFTVAKVNAANGSPANVAYGALDYNTITTKPDNSVIKKNIVTFGDSLNKLAGFIAKHEQSNRSVQNDQFADPFKAVESYADSEATLRNSAVLVEAKAIWERFTTNKVGTGADGEITSVYDLGMALKDTQDEDGVPFQALVFEDEEKFQKAFDDNFEAVQAFFNTDVDINPHAANQGTLQFLPGTYDTPITNTSVVGKPIAIAIVYQAEGQTIQSATATVGGVQVQAETIPAAAGPGNIKFAQNSILQGLEFRVDPKAGPAIAHTDNYTITYTPGMANLILDDAREMFNDVGLGGSTVDEMGIVKEEKTKLSDELERVTKELKNMINELTAGYQQVMMMDMHMAIQGAMIEAALGG